ncbi:hypothetical protein E2C01_054957 [Portunus trituberculatus]|uniref:Uncharacterized protein n=1 Tax=Portunus trituberculatus TaxID=210409 RepID=A0A5B7GUM9_PORTR|nr:hypothetical protein [Portunus trituberculatus]
MLPPSFYPYSIPTSLHLSPISPHSPPHLLRLKSPLSSHAAPPPRPPSCRPTIFPLPSPSCLIFLLFLPSPRLVPRPDWLPHRLLPNNKSFLCCLVSRVLSLGPLTRWTMMDQVRRLGGQRVGR